MTNKRLQDLSLAGALSDSDQIYIEQANQPYRVTLALLKAYVTSGLGSGGTLPGAPSGYDFVVAATPNGVDTTPDAFAFTDVSSATLSTLYTSNQITVSGINSPATVSVVGGEYQINGGSWVTASGTVSNGDLVRVRATSSSSNSTAVNVLLSIGGVSDTYTITTLAVAGSDTTPNAFTFTDITGATLSTVYTSNTITVSGIDTASPISITGGTYSKNGGSYTSTSGTVLNGDTVSVRATSSGSNSTAVNVALTIGGVSDTYTVTTAAAAPSSPLSFATLFIGDVSSMVNTSGKVSAWNSLDTSGNSFTQSNAALRPAYSSTKGLVFDGTALHLDNDAFPIGGLTTFTAFFIFENDAGATGQRGIFCFAGGTNDYQASGFTLTTNTPGYFLFYANGTTGPNGQVAPGDSLGVIYDGTNETAYRNLGTSQMDVVSVPYTAAHPATAMASVGSRVLSGVRDAPYYFGTIKKMVLSTVALNSTQRAELETWLHS